MDKKIILKCSEQTLIQDFYSGLITMHRIQRQNTNNKKNLVYCIALKLRSCIIS